MFAIFLMLAGVALIVGAKEISAQMAKGFVGIVLLLAAIPCLIQSCACYLSRPDTDGLSKASDALLLFLGAVVLAVVGLVAWRRRAERTKTREIWARRNGSPRARSLPAAPNRTPDGSHP